MKHTLNDQERKHLNQHIAEVEKRTRAQIVIAFIERSDSYPELPWKAFALGASMAGFGAVAFDMLSPGWSSNIAAMISVMVALGSGAVGALLCIFLPGFGRLFLNVQRAETEARQHAQSLFLSRELFKTHERTGLLLLISLFERQVVILPDKGLQQCLNQDVMQKIIAGMGVALAAGKFASAMEEGLESLESVLALTAPADASGNELPDTIIEEERP
jgi:putative membrane protein